MKNREIEFRAWDNEFLKMCFGNLYQDRWYSKTGFLDISSGGLECCSIMQYTGMKDKNGVKIFEGDIINCYESEVGLRKRMMVICVVKWDVETLSFAYCPNGNMNQPHQLLCYAIDSEVIGNIYENPELLK